MHNLPIELRERAAALFKTMSPLKVLERLVAEYYKEQQDFKKVGKKSIVDLFPGAPYPDSPSNPPVGKGK